MAGRDAVTVREVDLADDAQLERLIAFETEHGSPRVRTAAERRETFPAEWRGVLLAAEDAAGGLVGTGAAHLMPMMRAGTVMVNGFVRRGLGDDVLAALMDHIEAWQGDVPERELIAHVIDATAEERARWEAIGFERVGDRTRLVREVTDADRDLDVPVPDGVRIVALAERPDLEDATRTLWFAAHGDIPTAIPFDADTGATLRQDIGLEPDAPWPPVLRVAVHEDGDVVGVAYLHARDDGAYGHRFTGVAPAWRGRGLARALKADSIRLAAQLGATELVTSNDDTNPAMRAINDAFGYRHQYAIAMYRR